MYASPKEKLSSVSAQLISRVSKPNLNGLMDVLQRERVISKDEKMHLEDKNKLVKARELFDMVEGKGDQACSVLITALYEKDKFLCEDLNLRP